MSGVWRGRGRSHGGLYSEVQYIMGNGHMETPLLLWTDRRLWKHYLPATSFAGGNKPQHSNSMPNVNVMCTKYQLVSISRHSYFVTSTAYMSEKVRRQSAYISHELTTVLKPWRTIWSAYTQCKPHCYRFNNPCKVDLPVSTYSSVAELKLEGKYLWRSYWNLWSCCNVCSSTSQSAVYLCHTTCDAFLPEIREANCYYYWNEERKILP